MENKIDSNKIYLFESMPIPKAVFKVSLPTVLSMLVMVFYSLADTYFVGLLNNPIQTAAVTLASTIILLFNAIVNIFGIGASSLFSRALGAKDYKTAEETSVFGVFGCVFCALILSLICFVFNTQVLNLLGADELNFQVTKNYMFWTVILGATPAIMNTVVGQLVKSEGMAGHASIGMMSGCILNVILDPFFILPQFLNMGAAGAGLATFISNCFACLYYIILIVVIKRGKTFLSFNIRKLSLRKEVVVGVCAVGIPAAIQNILNVTGMTIINNIAASYGSEAVSAIGISHKLCTMSLYIAMGISSGITPIISYNYTSGNHKRLKDTIIYVAKMIIPLMLAITSIMIIFSSSFIRIFMDNDLVIKYGSVYIKEMAIAQPFLAIDFSAVGIYQALGKGKYSLIFAIMRKIVLEIPALFILDKLYPIYGIGYAQAVSEIVLAIAAIIMVKKIFNELNITV